MQVPKKYFAKGKIRVEMLSKLFKLYLLDPEENRSGWSSITFFIILSQNIADSFFTTHHNALINASDQGIGKLQS